MTSFLRGFPVERGKGKRSFASHLVGLLVSEEKESRCVLTISTESFWTGGRFLFSRSNSATCVFFVVL